MTEYKPGIYSEGIWVGKVETVCIALIREIDKGTLIGEDLSGDIVDISGGTATVSVNCSGFENDRKVGPWELTSWNDS